jgi:hypothetical protein
MFSVGASQDNVTDFSPLLAVSVIVVVGAEAEDDPPLLVGVGFGDGLLTVDAASDGTAEVEAGAAASELLPDELHPESAATSASVANKLILNLTRRRVFIHSPSAKTKLHKGMPTDRGN